jgi:arylsulfatase A-like enzyme
VIAGLLFVLLLVQASAAVAANVVLIIADDLGVDKVAAYAESPTAGPTPAIDSLAAGGVLFRNAWSYPVCSPARSSIATGLHPMRHAVGWYTTPEDPRLVGGLDTSRQSSGAASATTSGPRP